MRRGDVPAALNLAERGIDRSRGEWRQRFLLLAVELHLYRGELPRARDLLSSAELNTPATPELRARKRVLDGYLLVVEERMDEAHRVLAEAAALPGATPETASQAFMLRARASLSQGQHLAAREHYRESYQLAARTSDPYEQAAALLNLGFIELNLSYPDRAIPILQRAEILAQQSDASLLHAAVLSNLSICRARLGDYEAAVDARRRALAVQQQAGIRKHVATSLGQLGYMYLELKRPREAVDVFRQAVNIAQQLRSNAEEAIDAAGLASALIELGQLDEAVRWNEQAKAAALAVSDGETLATVAYNNARLMERRDRPDEAIRLYRDLLGQSGLRPAREWMTYAALARIYSKRGDRATARREYEAALRAVERTRADLLRTDYKLGFLSELIGLYQAYVDDLVQWGDDATALRVVESSRAQLLAARTSSVALAATSADWSRVARQTGSVILSYWIGPTRSYLWAITEREVRRFAMPTLSELRPLVERYSVAIERDMRDTAALEQEAGIELYRKLVAPAAPLITKGIPVFVVPDGPLHDLNLETLLVPAARVHYWIEDVTLAVAPSISVLAAPAGHPHPTGPALLVGDPVPADPEYPKLEFARAELEHISRRLGARKTLRTGPDATPANVLGAGLESYALVHFAAHAAPNRESPLDSAIILSPHRDGYKLYTRDVAGLRLSSELVTVSACHGAGARTYSGEGLIGFAWAFLRAGARNVVAGLWDVSDRSTAELMDKLYEGLVAGRAPAESLRRAKLHLIASGGNYRKPYYWAPFQVYCRSAHASKKTYSH